MFHWIVDSRSGFVALLMAACIVALAIYALPALLAWSMGGPAGCNPDLGDHIWEWREF